MLEQLIQQSDKLIRELFGQYSNSIEKEVLHFKSSLKNVVNDIVQKLISKEEIERKQEDNNIREILNIKNKEIEKLFEDINLKLDKLDKKYKQIESLIDDVYLKMDALLEQQNQFNIELSDSTNSINCLKNNVNMSIKTYIKDNPKDIRKSFFNFKKKNNL